jgi:hypothetical protein
MVSVPVKLDKAGGAGTSPAPGRFDNQRAAPHILKKGLGRGLNRWGCTAYERFFHNSFYSRHSCRSPIRFGPLLSSLLTALLRRTGSCPGQPERAAQSSLTAPDLLKRGRPDTSDWVTPWPRSALTD